MTIFISSIDSYTVTDIECLLLAQEHRIEKHHKDLDSKASTPSTPLVTTNLAHNSQFKKNNAPFAYGQYTSFFPSGQFRGNPRGGFSGAIFLVEVVIFGHQVVEVVVVIINGTLINLNANSSGKFGHIVMRCYHRFDLAFQGPTLVLPGICKSVFKESHEC
ncbi:hypothetical protein PanWU01x14_269240 [Parasponia andersonii]|uniref:Uncharacterized protein n=1 Tax=Parasponia andersonii TaxID=3476 RepID=A0A2P5B5M7_PARAD|nr:hypothetical protein PanWU01x14_269240 [Parasponia andersonii]